MIRRVHESASIKYSCLSFVFKPKKIRNSSFTMPLWINFQKPLLKIWTWFEVRWNAEGWGFPTHTPNGDRIFYGYYHIRVLGRMASRWFHIATDNWRQHRPAWPSPKYPPSLWRPVEHNRKPQIKESRKKLSLKIWILAHKDGKVMKSRVEFMLFSKRFVKIKTAQNCATLFISK